MAFQAQQTADLATVRDKAVAASLRLAEAEAMAPAAALRVALGTAQDGDAEIVASIPVLRAELASLRMAHEAASQAEENRKQAAKHRELASRVRAAQQAIGRLDRDMHASALAAEAMVRKFAAAAEAARSLYALFPNLDAPTPSRLARVIQTEIERAARATGVRFFEHAPWTKNVENTATGQIVSLDQILSAGLGPIKHSLKGLMPQVSPAADPLPVVEADEAAASDGVFHPPSLAAAPIPDEIEERAA